MDRCQLCVLLRNHLLHGPAHYQQPLPDQHDYDHRQRLLYPYLLLDH